MRPFALKIGRQVLFFAVLSITAIMQGMEAPDRIKLKLRLNLRPDEKLTVRSEESKSGSSIRRPISSRLGARARSFATLSEGFRTIEIEAGKNQRIGPVIEQELAKAKNRCPVFHIASKGIKKSMTMKKVQMLIGNELAINCWKRPEQPALIELAVTMIFSSPSEEGPVKGTSETITIVGRPRDRLENALMKIVKDRGCPGFHINHPVVTNRMTLQQISGVLKNTHSKLTVECWPEVQIGANIVVFGSKARDVIQPQDQADIIIAGDEGETLKSAAARTIKLLKQYQHCDFSIDHPTITQKMTLGHIENLLGKGGILQLQCFPKQSDLVWEKTGHMLNMRIIIPGQNDQKTAQKIAIEVDESTQVQDALKNFCGKIKKIEIRGKKESSKILKKSTYDLFEVAQSDPVFITCTPPKK